MVVEVGERIGDMDEEADSMREGIVAWGGAVVREL